MTEYGYPKRAIAFVTAAPLAGTGLGTAILVALIAPLGGLASFPGKVTFLLTGDPAYLRTPARVMLAWGIGLSGVLFLWAAGVILWFVCRRWVTTVYSLDASGLERLRGGKVLRLGFADITRVRLSYLRGLILSTASASMAVSLNLERADSLVVDLRKNLMREGVEFSEELQAKATREVVVNRWKLRQEPRTSVACLVTLFLLAGLNDMFVRHLGVEGEDRLLFFGLCLIVCASVLWVLTEWLPYRLFKHWGEAEHDEPGTALAWIVLLLSACLTLVVYLFFAAMALYVFT